MPDEKRPTINEEAGLPENWVPLDAPPIIPSRVQNQNPDNSSSSTAPLVGSLPPGYQLDADFVRNAYRGQLVPNLSLMPLGIQGNASSNAGIQSTATQITNQIIAAIPPPVSTTDVETVCSNVVASTAYNVQLSDRATLISLTNNAGGTITLPGTGVGGFAFIQNGHNLVFSDVGTVTLTNGAKNLIFLVVWSARSFTNTTFTVTDTNGNMWTALYNSVGDLGNTTQAAFYAEGVVAGSNTITVTAVHGAGGAAEIDISVAEYQGIKPSGSLDAFSEGGNTSVNITTVTANDLVIFSAAGASGGAHATQAPWTSRYNDGFQIIQDQIVATPGTLVNCVGANSPEVTNGDPRALAAFKPSIPLSATGFTPCWFTYIENIGTGTFILQSNALIDNSGSSVTIGPNQGLMVVYDGTNWFTERGISFPLPLSVANGGTGVSSLTAFDILVGGGTSPVGFIAPGAPGTVLTSNGAGSNPTFQTVNVPTTVGSNVLIGTTTVSDSADVRGQTIFTHIRGRKLLNACKSWSARFVFGATQGAGTIGTGITTTVYTMNQVNPSGNMFAPYTLSSVATSVGGNTTYTGTNLSTLLTGSGTVAVKVNIAGFTNSGNNGTALQVVACTSTTLTVVSGSGVAETHAATAQLCILAAPGGSGFTFGPGVMLGGMLELISPAYTLAIDGLHDYVIATFIPGGVSIPVIVGIGDTFANDGNTLKSATFTGDATGLSLFGVLPTFTGYGVTQFIQQLMVVS
jgi:hypothetical protein